MADDALTKALPPYAPFDAMLSVVEGMHASGLVPSRIDAAEVMPSMAGGTRAHVMSAMKYLGLVDAANHPTTDLQLLVQTFGTDSFAVELKKIVVAKYNWVFSDLDIGRATSRQLRERFKEGGVEGSTGDRSIRFFLKAMKAAGMSYSQLLKARKPRGTGTPRRQSQPPSAASNGAAAVNAPVMTSAPAAPAGMIAFPLYFKNSSTPGAITVPSDISPEDTSVIELTLRIIEAYAGQSKR